MASGGSSSRRLDAGGDQEVVFCHACTREWFRHESGLICPACNSDVTEIISASSDPRDMSTSNPSASSRLPPLPPPQPLVDDSDPEEADIEEHTSPQGVHVRRDTRSGSGRIHHDPSLGPVFDRLQDVMRSLSQSQSNEGSGPARPSDDTPGIFPTRIHRTTFGTVGGRTATFTFVSDTTYGHRMTASVGAEPPPFDTNAFGTIFNNILQDLTNPSANRPPSLDPRGRFISELADMVGNLNSGHAVFGGLGDAVFSQEAFDRILNQLMEANGSSNAAPPASEEALSKLARKPVDETFLGAEGRAECSICIDEMKEGETAVFLPCKHWFHEACVVLWLKEHNTCPVCRAPIEKPHEGSGNRPEDSYLLVGSSMQSDRSQTPRRSSRSAGLESGQSQGSNSTSHGETSVPNDDGTTASGTAVPPHSPWTTFTTSVTDASRDRRSGRGDGPSTTGVDADATRSRRRTSHSPTSPRVANPAEQTSRTRQRSPSENGRRVNGERDGQRQPSSGPWGWLRGRWSGASGFGANGRWSRDEGQS